MRGFVKVLVFVLIGGNAWAADNLTVRAVKGVAYTETGEMLKKKSVLRWGDVVHVAPAGQLDIVSADEISMRIYGPSAVTLRQTKKTKSSWLDLAFGRMIAAFKPGTAAAISTRTSVAGVRGTVVYVEESDAHKGYTCVCEGRVEHTHRKNRDLKQLVETQHHSAIYATDTTLESAGMFNHTDDDVSAVKALIGR